MNLKKTRVRLKDLHHGAILYIAHPWYGIRKVTVVGKPYFSKYQPKSLFLDVIKHYTNWDNKDRISLCDSGIVESSYSLYRTFTKLKQAQAYVQWGQRDPLTVKRQHRHEAMNDAYDVWEAV